MTSNELRKEFLRFFESRGHTFVDSAPLIPVRDPSLLFTSAGMVQFKPYFSGLMPLPFTRAVSVQKCLRVSDLENVGKTVKHETLFEMLGNFSFGDYFKREAIEWAWEFLLEVVKLSPDRLQVTVHEKDDEAYSLWTDHVGLAGSLVHRLGDESNMWGPAGDTGACGPCSEIYFDMGSEFGCGKTECRPGCDCDRYFEVWNLVFPEFDKKEDGRMMPLANRGVDTGMGLERLAVAVQAAKSLFEIDLFAPVIEEAARILEVPYKGNEVAYNVIADHVRALTFACSEGIIPSNEGRGYVLRRLLRRALRRGVLLGKEEPFLYRMVGTVADAMREPYPELVEKREQVSLLLKSEEERFFRTLGQGLVLFEEILSAGGGSISGQDAFKLYDTYGFPIDLTVEMATERGARVDVQIFEEQLALQRDRARSASRFFSPEERGEWHDTGITDGLHFLDAAGAEVSGPAPFVGYEKTTVSAQVAGWKIVDGDVLLKLDTTPFYAEAGGQVGDTGVIYSDDFEVRITDTIWMDAGIVHVGRLERGEVNSGTVTARVDAKRRKDIARNHTATHLLHAALRTVLGKHVRQEGSFVGPDRLRFDFVHYNPLTRMEIEKIEENVNERVRENTRVDSIQTTREKATRDMGAIALFGEKYGEEVRVVRIGGSSAELCGGTHLELTGDIGLFKIVSESAVAAGIRRIEAVTGRAAYERVVREERVLLAISDSLGSGPEDLEEKFRRLQEEEKTLKKRVRQLESKLASVMAVKLVGKARHVEGVKVLSSLVEFTDLVGLRQMADETRARVKENCVGVLGSSIEGKAVFVAFVTDDLSRRLKAGDVAREVAKLIGGGGGGKPTIAEAGARDAGRIDEAMQGVPEVVRELLKRA